MPLIHVQMAKGRTPQQKHALLSSITEAVQHSIEAPLPSIRVWITEFEPAEYMAGGETLAARRA